MSKEDEYALEAAFQRHPEWRERYWNGSLDEQDERHFLVHAAVEGMLSADSNLLTIATEAVERGLDPHDVRHSLGRAFLAGLWYAAHEGVSYDPDNMANRFVNKLQRHGGGAKPC